MPRYSTAFGMDVHLRSTTVCALDAETGEAVTRRFRGNPWGEVAEWMSASPARRSPPTRAATSASPRRGELSGLGVDWRRRGRLQGPEVGGRPLVQERPQRRGRMARPDTVARYLPGMGAVPRDRGAQGPRRGPRRGDREARGGEAAAPGVPSPPWLRLRRHDAGRKPPEVLDVRLPQVARQGPARRRRRHPGAGGAEERGSRRPPRRATTSSPSTGPPSRRAPSRRRSRRSSRSRGAASRSPPPSRPRSATSRGSAPAGR